MYVITMQQQIQLQIKLQIIVYNRLIIYYLLIKSNRSLITMTIYNL